MSRMVLGYWNFRGFGECCRYILEYCKCDYEDLQYHRPSKSDHSPWRNIAHTFGLDFPNLPYLIDGDTKLTESVAILKYIGRKHGLLPKDEENCIRADILEGVLVEYKTRFFDVFFVPEDKFKQEMIDFQSSRIFPMCEKIVKYIGHRKWLISDDLTFLDFLFYTCLSQTDALYPSVIKSFPRLQKYLEDFKAIPAIDCYLKSGRFEKYPAYDPYIRTENILKDKE